MASYSADCYAGTKKSSTTTRLFRTLERNTKYIFNIGVILGEHIGNDKKWTYWVTWANTHAKNSASVNDLDVIFKPKVKAFIKALEEGGATVKVKATKRNKKRAYLFHWRWKIALGKCKVAEATALAGVDIKWDHGDVENSKSGAKEMVTGFDLAIPPQTTKCICSQYDFQSYLRQGHRYGDNLERNN